MSKQKIAAFGIKVYDKSGVVIGKTVNLAIDTKEVVVVINSEGVKSFKTSYKNVRDSRVPFVYVA